MKLLIAYSTKHGTTAACVERLTRALRGMEVHTARLEEETPNVREYDLVLLGGSVYFGRFRPALRQFLKENEAALCEKPLGLFWCCGRTEDHEYYGEKLFPKCLRERAFAQIFFGGTLRIREAGLWERILLHSMRSAILESEINDGEYTPTLPTVLPESVDMMATYVREAARRL